MNRFDNFIDEIEHMVAKDTFLDKLVMWACGLSAVACLVIVMGGF